LWWGEYIPRYDAGKKKMREESRGVTPFVVLCPLFKFLFLAGVKPSEGKMRREGNANNAKIVEELFFSFFPNFPLLTVHLRVPTGRRGGKRHQTPLSRRGERDHPPSSARREGTAVGYQPSPSLSTSRSVVFHFS
jgi:hypothetical protein